MTDTAEVFPLDVAALQPGDVVPVERLERILLRKHGSEDYQHALRKLMARIERERAQLGRPIVLVQRKGAIVVLRAAEHVHVAGLRSSATRRKLIRAEYVLLTTPVSELTADEMRRWERLAVNTAARRSAFSKRGPKRIATGVNRALPPSKGGAS